MPHAISSPTRSWRTGLALLLAALAIALSPHRAHAQPDSQCDPQWLPGFGSPTALTASAMVALPDGGAFAAGSFITIDNVLISSAVVRWSGSEWSLIGTATSATPGAAAVYALAVLPSGDMIAAGHFTAVNGVAANNIARWDGEAWLPLGSGMTGTSPFATYINALTMLPNGDLLAGGSFTTAGGVAASSIARWDGSNWSPLSTSTFPFISTVSALTTLPNGDAVAAGVFIFLGTGTANIARWNGVTWSPVGLAGTGGQVTELSTLPNGDLLAAGNFTSISGVNANNIARWNGIAWSPLGSGTSGGTTFGGRVDALAVLPNGDVIAGGYFDSAGAVSAGRIARWDGDEWLAMGTGITGNSVRALVALPSGDVIVGGFMNTAGGLNASTARWDGSRWWPLGSGMRWGEVLAFTSMPNGDIVAGGTFTEAGAVNANRIALWNGLFWSPLGSGVDGHITALATLPDGSLIAGGAFGNVGGVTTKHIARWDGAAWSALGTGMSGALGDTVEALLVTPSGDLIVGGLFSTAGGVPANDIARWNGATWAPFASGTDGYVAALALLPNGHVIAAGVFAHAGGVPAPNIARWDGSAWHPLGSGTNGKVAALAVLPDGDLIAGGYFTIAGGVEVNYIARWDGAVWSPLDTGMQGNTPWGGAVNTLAVLTDGDLVAGGLFDTAGQTPANQIARWDGVAWSAMESGTNGYVRSLIALSENALLAGGGFQAAGGHPSASIAHWGPPHGCDTCLSDYTGDTLIDILDFLDFFQDFGTCDQLPAPCGTLGNPDLNGDTTIDILDFLDFLDAFGNGC